MDVQSVDDLPLPVEVWDLIMGKYLDTPSWGQLRNTNNFFNINSDSEVTKRRVLHEKYKDFIRNHNSDEALEYFSKVGDWRYIQLLIDYGADYWNRGLRGAAQGGHRDLVKYFISRGANDWNQGLASAAKGGHRDLIDLFVSLGANDWNYGLYGAARGGHRDLVDLFILRGADNWNWALALAAEGGHRDLVKYFISQGANSWNWALWNARQGGNQEIIDLLSAYRDNDF